MSFDGFVASDFSTDVSGTSWRGELSEEIRDCTPESLKVYSLPREPKIFIRQTGYDDRYQAKLFVAVNEDGLRCGYYLERPLSGAAALEVEPEMRLTENADWSRFLTGLESGGLRPALSGLAAEIPQSHLSLRSEGEQLAPAGDRRPLNAEELQQNRVLDALYEYLSRWDGQQWLDIYIQRVWSKEEIVGMGSGIVELICETLVACLPVYHYTAGKPEGVDSLFAIEERLFAEGAERIVVQTRRERDSKLRDAMIESFGRDCMVCGFNFDRFYGKDLAEGYIEVHHLKPISEMNGEDEVSPDDCIVICSNCHRVIHRGAQMLDWRMLKDSCSGQ